ncbi:hypothetical protein CSA56_03070 [candidate division KSB3 bacterium]|uniref:CHAT domain-containing protein n=1 Tax=candidate division KSB3 bacterium TaxID=2044937 RepID=A0A2G6KLM4_9BACT|nr:MAG: hypothetical protein CSA56_03070 [candidate division KSB3 bacterium]
MQKILILAANPKNTDRLRLDEEVREIEEGLKRSRNREQFEIKQQWAVRPQDIRRAMLDFQPNIVHFSGHGEGEVGIVLENRNGQAQLVTSEALAGLFKLFADNVRCVVLNACYSVAQAEAIVKHIDYVVGMEQSIGDQAAVEFSTAFYDGLGAGESFEFAYNVGCNALRLAGFHKHRPILKTQHDAEKKNPGAVIVLSYHAEQKQYIQPLANALCQRGIVPWLDMDDLEPLKQTIERHCGVVCFIPETDVERITQILRKILENGQLSIQKFESGLSENDREAFTDQLSQKIYRVLNLRSAQDVIIAIDQRGDGARQGEPDLPEVLNEYQIPCLIFRPDMGKRTHSQTLMGTEWKKCIQRIEKSLDALGNLRNNQQSVRIYGNAQLAFAFFLGLRINRTTLTSLYCYYYNGSYFTNEKQDFKGLGGGNEHCETVRSEKNYSRSPLPAKILPGEQREAIALYVGTQKYYDQFIEHLNSQQDPPAAVFIETLRYNEEKDEYDRFENSDQVMAVIKNAVALLERFRREHKTQTVELYCELPFHAVPLFAANLTGHALPSIKFMEFRRDLPIKKQKKERVEQLKKERERLDLDLKKTLPGSSEEEMIRKQIDTCKAKLKSTTSEDDSKMYVHLDMNVE